MFTYSGLTPIQHSGLVNSVLNVKALLGAFSVIVKTDCEADGSSAALIVILYVRICRRQDSGGG